MTGAVGGAPLSPVQRDLQRLAAVHHLGAVVNALDLVGVRRGGDRLPASAYLAGVALRIMLRDLGLTEPGGAEQRLLADVWRGVEQ